MLSRFLRKLFGFETRLDNLERLQRRVTPGLEWLEERTLLSGNLQVGIVAPPTAAPGASITYLVTVANVDSAAASGVSLTESLPAGVAYQSQVQTGGPSFTLSQDANVVSDTIDSLDAGASASFSITGVVAADEAAGAVLTDTAAATGSGALSGSVPWFTTVQPSGSDGGSDSIGSGSGSAGGASVSHLSSGGGVGFNAASGSTATTLSSNYNPLVAGQTVTFTAVVNGQFNTTASEGYVSFWNGPNEVATGSLAATDTTHQFATFATPLPVGSWPYTATYPGNGSFLPSTSPVLTQNVVPATTTSLISSVDPSAPNYPVTFTATVAAQSGGAAPTGTVTFYSNGVSLGTVTVTTGSSSSTASLTKTFATAGSYSITASYLGGSNFGPSSSALTQTVEAEATSTYLTSSANPSYYGNSVTFTATVVGAFHDAPTGNVTFECNGVAEATVALSGGGSNYTLASFSMPFPTQGSFPITAIYDPLAPFVTSTGTLTQTVQAETTSTYLQSSANPSYYGNSVTFTATVVGAVGAPTGNVTFECNGYTEATVPLSGGGSNYKLASFSMPFPTQGGFPITAIYDPDNTFAVSSAALTQTVQAETTSTYLTSGANPSYYGNSVTFTAEVVGAVGAPTGNVTFECNGYTEATVPLSGGGSNYKLASFSMPFPTQGGFPITAIYDPDNTFAVSSAALTQTVQAETTSTYLTSGANPSVAGQDVTFTAEVVGAAGAPTGNVTFEYNGVAEATVPLSGGGSNYTLASFSMPFPSAGGDTITAVYDPDNTFAVSSDALTQTVQQASTATSVTSSADPSGLNQAVTFTAVVNGAYGGTPTGTVTFLDGTTTLGTGTLSPSAQATFTTSALSVGDHSITAVYGGDPNFSGSTSAVLTQTVQQASTTSSVTSSADPSGLGQAVTFTALVNGAYGGTPTGTVAFMNGSTTLGTATLSAGAQGSWAVFRTSTLPLGSNSITVVYGGDENFTYSTSAALNQTVQTATIWYVINTGDAGAGTLATRMGDLRFCLTNAGTGDVIDFAIPGSGVQTIAVSSALPAITHALTLDGWSQSGASPSSPPLIQINGAGITGGPTAAGLYVSGSGVTIQGLAIYGFSGDGVDLNNLAGSAGDLLQGCYIGTDVNGDSGVGNGTGVLVEGPNDTVGDPTGGATTIVSGNTNDGIDVSGANATGALIIYDWIGLGVTGLTALGNGQNGLVVAGAGLGVASNNKFANGINGAAVDLTDTSGELVKNNLIGVDKNGVLKMPNGNGVVLQGNSSNNTIGGTAVADRNIIAGNSLVGVDLEGANVQNNLVEGNYIGLDQNGNVQGNTGGGVVIGTGAHDNTIGGTGFGVGNVISGNGNDGVEITGSGTSKNLVAGNYIGTDAKGATGIDGNKASTGNARDGVRISDGASNNAVGGAIGFANVISGNAVNGVNIDHASQNVIVNNYIGTDNAGSTAIPNVGDGVFIQDGATANTVGGTAAAARNVISGNALLGVAISDEGTSQNLVAGNYIGTDASGATAFDRQGKRIGNGGVGVGILSGATANTVGGTVAGARNVISGNVADGVGISSTGTSQNVVAGNYIGTDASGKTAFDSRGNPIGNTGNGVAIINGATANTIGGTAAGSLNLISGNGKSGVDIFAEGTSNNLVTGDYIGTDVSGTTATDSNGKSIGNGIAGVLIEDGATANTIGGTVAGSLNVISGNVRDGVNIDGSGTSQNVIDGDYIGTDKNGGTAIANGRNGVSITNSASNNTIGALAPGQGQNTTVTVISGNTQSGVGIGSNNNLVINCYIGTDKTGKNQVGNLKDGIDLFGDSNTIGGLQTTALNVISGNGPALGNWNANTGFGVMIEGGGGVGAVNNVIEGDYIGTDNTGNAALGNRNSGIFFLSDGGGNTVGGAAAGATCVIAKNGTPGSGGYGVDLSATTGETVQRNNIGVGLNPTCTFRDFVHFRPER